jgi:hypothetical protein
MVSLTRRIPDEPKKDFEEAEIKISEITRKALEKEVQRMQAQRHPYKVRK